MIRELILFAGSLCCQIVYAQSAADAVHIRSVSTTLIDAKTTEQCGISMLVPNLQNVYDQSIGFVCVGTYKNGHAAILDMDFQYDPNERNGGE